MSDEKTFIQKAKAFFTGEPQKTFQEVGITNEDKSLTDQGRVMFDDFLLEKYGEEFKEMRIDPVLKELKKAKK